MWAKRSALVGFRFADLQTVEKTMRKAPFLVIAAAAVALPLPVLAASYPFSISSTPHEGIHAVICGGPYLRTSGCNNFDGQDTSPRNFYTADTGIASPKGLWDCHVDVGACATQPFGQAANVQFCGPGFGDHPNTVELFYDHDNRTLTHNQLAPTVGFAGILSCPATVAVSKLGHKGEDDAASGSRRLTTLANRPQHGETQPTPAGVDDVDTFDYEGEAGETVDVTLAVDGKRGGFGEVATLRIMNQWGEPIAEQTGPLPLTLQATLEGPTAIVVEQNQGLAEHFRGGYTLTLERADDSGVPEDRHLIPREDVSH